MSFKTLLPLMLSGSVTVLVLAGGAASGSGTVLITVEIAPWDGFVHNLLTDETCYILDGDSSRVVARTSPATPDLLVTFEVRGDLVLPHYFEDRQTGSDGVARSSRLDQEALLPSKSGTAAAHVAGVEVGRLCWWAL